MPLDSKVMLDQMDYALDCWCKAISRAQHDDLSDLGEAQLAELVSLLAHTIDRFAPTGSQYHTRAQEVLKAYSPCALHMVHGPLYGILKSLRDVYDRGYLQTIQELVHADVFSDFLVMAKYLLTEGYKDPAAVLAGGVLEAHLRKLCLKHGINISDPTSGRPRMSGAMNDDLAKTAYDKLEQKGVTFWLDLRNKAAHGDYGGYDARQVQLMIQGVQDFLVRHRA
jgi:hypothetical protein